MDWTGAHWPTGKYTIHKPSQANSLPGVNLPIGPCWPIRSLQLSLPAHSLPRPFPPWNFCSPERNGSGTFVLWNICSQEYSLPGIFAPENFVSCYVHDIDLRHSPCTSCCAYILMIYCCWRGIAMGGARGEQRGQLPRALASPAGYIAAFSNAGGS